MTDTDPKDELHEDQVEDAELDDIAGGAQEPFAPVPLEPNLDPLRRIL